MSSKVESFTREELIVLRTRAENLASMRGTSSGWVRAYLNLADATDHLDAMIARSSVTESGIPSIASQKS